MLNRNSYCSRTTQSKYCSPVHVCKIWMQLTVSLWTIFLFLFLTSAFKNRHSNCANIHVNLSKHKRIQQLKALTHCLQLKVRIQQPLRTPCSVVREEGMMGTSGTTTWVTGQTYDQRGKQLITINKQIND